MPEQNVCSWNAMLAAYGQEGDINCFNQLFFQMIQEGLIGDRITCLSMISVCTSHGSLLEGKRLHASIVGSLYERDAALQNALISIYGKWGSKEDTTSIFHAFQGKNLITWNAMIAAFAQAQKMSESKESFARMQLEGMLPDEVTFSSMFSAFENEFVVREAKCLHALVTGCVHETDLIVRTAIITTYGNCGRIEEARIMFDRTTEKDVAVWNAMFTAYSQHGNVEASMSLFCDMLADDQTPNKVTFAALISVCAGEAVLMQGSWIHHQIMSCNLKVDLETGNSLVNMYGRCGSLEDALEVFSGMREHNLVSWSSLIMAYTQRDLTEEALQLFKQMVTTGITPDKVMYICIVPVCASEAALLQGMKVHHCIVSHDFDTDDVMTTALLNMYSKCGSIEDAHRIFDFFSVRSLVSWNSLIAAHAHHGHGIQAILSFNHMIGQGLFANECTFYSILSACSHAGLLEEGLCYFNSMVRQCFIVPTVEHFNCMVDLFGRAGQLEAVDFVLESMGLQPSGASWMTMLGACRVHSDRERGENAAAQVCNISLRDATPMVLLSNIYRASKVIRICLLAMRLY